MAGTSAGNDNESPGRTEEIVTRHGSGTPDVSVIIPAFNRATFLAEAVASAIAQGGRHRVEVVVVDDGSSDASVEVAVSATKAADAAVVVRQTNRGPSAARNTGIRHARGRFVSFLDSDDRLVPGKVDAQMALLADDRSAGLCVGRWGWYDARFARLIASFGPRRSATWPILPCFLRNEHFPVATALFRRETIAAAAPWPEQMRNWEDHVWMIGMGLQGVRCIHLPREVLQVREHTEGRASGVSTARALYANTTYAQRLLAFDWPEDPPLRDALAERLLVLAQDIDCGGDAETAQRIFDRADDLAGTARVRAALRLGWGAERAAGPGRRHVRTTTARLIGLRTRVRWHLPTRAWRAWEPRV